MKKLLLLLFTLITTLSFTQDRVASANFVIAATGRTTSVRLIGTPASWHHLTLTPNGAVSSFTFSVDSSLDNSSWTSGGIISSASINGGNGSVNNAVAVRTNYVSINVTALAGGTVNVRYDAFADAVDPCNAVWTSKTNSLINGISGATTLVTGSAGSTVYVCGVVVSSTGTPTITFSSGTGTNCGTGTNNLIGVMSVLASTPLRIGYGGQTAFSSGIGRNICATPAGTTPSFSGVITTVTQ